MRENSVIWEEIKIDINYLTDRTLKQTKGIYLLKCRRNVDCITKSGKRMCYCLDV